MNLEKFNHFSYIFLLKNTVVCYIAVFFLACFVLSTILSAADVDCDLIEWQCKDDSVQEGCFDDLAEMEFLEFTTENSIVSNKTLVNNRLDGHSKYDPDILRPPPRAI
jgi:hypothetical protein